MILIFLLLCTSCTLAMDDNRNDGPFTPQHFDAFLKKIDDEEQQRLAQQKQISKPAAKVRIINVPPTIILNNRPAPDTDNDDHGTTASNSSPRPQPIRTEDGITNEQEPTELLESTDHRTATVHCFIANCDWYLRYDPTLQGTQEGQQFLELVDEMLFHCHEQHWNLRNIINYMDCVMRNHPYDDTHEER